MLNDEIIGAYLDGELTPGRRAEVERELARDGGAAARLARMRAGDDLLRRAVPVMGSESDGLAAAILGQSKIWDRSTIWRLGSGWGRGAAAIAAACVLGLLAGRMSAPDQAFGPGFGVGRDVASVLDRAVSGAETQIAGGEMRVALSFRTDSGNLCRQFQTTSEAGAADGVACRSGGAWRMVVQAAVAEIQGYRTAGGGDAIASAVSAMGAVTVLDEAEERAAIATNWRSH